MRLGDLDGRLPDDLIARTRSAPEQAGLSE
jgi:hypothetical protein